MQGCFLFRYASRSVLIGFHPPQVDPTTTQYCSLPQLMNQAKSAIGFMISLGKKFSETGISEIDMYIKPKLKSMLPNGVWPRVIPGYASLIWFTYEVSSDKFEDSAFLVLCFRF